MRTYRLVGWLVSAAFMAGCAASLTPNQKLEYESLRSRGMLVEEKSPGAGAVLGLLPGGGSFYAREPGFGVVNLLCWPLSILWDPVSGYEGAKAINYEASMRDIRRRKDTEVAVLDDKLRTGELSKEAYLVEKERVEEKYAY